MAPNLIAMPLFLVAMPGALLVASGYCKIVSDHPRSLMDAVRFPRLGRSLHWGTAAHGAAHSGAHGANGALEVKWPSKAFRILNAKVRRNDAVWSLAAWRCSLWSPRLRTCAELQPNSVLLPSPSRQRLPPMHRCHRRKRRDVRTSRSIQMRKLSTTCANWPREFCKWN